MCATSLKGMSVEQAAELPPLIVGYVYGTFILASKPEYRCPMDSPATEFPISREPIWRGEIPDGAECSQCGLPLAELE